MATKQARPQRATKTAGSSGSAQTAEPSLSRKLSDNYPEFGALSLMDLLRARDLYHRHLMNKAGVVATAIGKYRIRKKDSWPEEKKKIKGTYPRTLANSEVRSYSWPCILVFVNEWMHPKDFVGRNKKSDPNGFIANRLYLPDGTLVPVCVVQAPKEQVGLPSRDNGPVFPRQFLGGGYPLLQETQGVQQFATAGCLVTDGHTCYALTSQHVTGRAGEPVYSFVGGDTSKMVGISSDKQLSRRLFEEVYPGWPGRESYLHMDIGLVALEDKTTWRPDIYNVGELKDAVDLSSNHFVLDLVGADVRAHGAASGDMAGTVCALFYRYKAMGGFEYVSDFLIGPREDVPFQTHPGDSGTVWVLDYPQENTENHKLDRKPLALQWGGHIFSDETGKQVQSYAMATCLSTVLNQLDLDLIRNWGYELPEYWGAVGHYTIANIACQKVSDSHLRKLMNANLANITFKMNLITANDLKGLASKKEPQFVPMADVPDLAWQSGAYPRGGPKTNKESPNHFADMDEPPPGGAKSLLDLCRGPHGTVNVASVDPKVWLNHYDLFKKRKPRVKSETRTPPMGYGLLPFRVAQIYKEMVKFVKAKDVASFVAAAGILAHYLGDAGQPLHISYLHHGDPDDAMRDPQAETSENVAKNKISRQNDVHGIYESDMFKYKAIEMQNGVATAAKKGSVPLIKGHRAAAYKTVELMLKTFDILPPKTIVDRFKKFSPDDKPKPMALALWDSFNGPTIKVMANSCRYLAMLWESAWKEGGGTATMAATPAITTKKLIGLYSQKKFLESLTIDQAGKYW